MMSRALFSVAAVAALASAHAIAPVPAQPPHAGTFYDLPGNETCVSCNFVLALFVLAVELALLWPLTSYCASKQVVTSASNSIETVTVGKRSWLSIPPSAVGALLGAAGWLYWFLTFATYWNFISWALLIGPILVCPAIVQSYRANSTSPTISWLTWRRVKLSGWLMALLMIALFQNLTAFPEQLVRHLNKSESLITPTDPLVLKLRDNFYDLHPKETYDAMPFAERMATVDTFIKDTVNWKSDMSQYHDVGLLTTPNEVLTRMAGDCQRQSVTTASLLFALGGVQAYCSETPFHWWTHAVDLTTRETYDLNSHGHAGLEGSVTPQPVDMMFTWYPAHCTVGVDNCTEVVAHNRQTMHYVAEPWRAFAIAFTGTHEFRRDILPHFAGSNFWLLPVIGLGIALLFGFYASYYHADLTASLKTGTGFIRLLKRVIVCAVPGAFAMSMFFGWGYLYYPVCLIHMVGVLTFSLTFVCNDGYNRSIGTPVPVPTKSTCHAEPGVPAASAPAAQHTYVALTRRQATGTAVSYV